MVASKVRKAARKDARQRLLEQVKREDKRKKEIDKAVFGDFEEKGGKAEDSSSEDSDSEDNGVEIQDEDSTLRLDQDVEMDGADNSKPTKGNLTKEEAKALRKARKQKKREEQAEIDAEKTKPRFICFVGQLPFSATTESIKKHFARIEPTEIRHSTQKGSDKSRGFAFLEFDNYERMNDCLRLYHHTMFDDGLGGEPCKINIELTAGGGGNKSKERKDRIKVKNAKLKEERKKKKAEKKAIKAAKKKDPPKRDKTKYNNRRGKWSAARMQNGEGPSMATGANATAPGATPAAVPPPQKTAAGGGSDSAQGGGTGGGVHPSRLARIQV